MPSIQPPDIRFSGYRRTKAGTAELYLPGHSRAQSVQAEILKPGCNQLKTIDMQQDGDYWVSRKEDTLPLGTAYRFKVAETDEIDATCTDPEDGEAVDVTFNKNGSYWEIASEDAPPADAPVTYRIPVADNPRFRVEKHVPGKPPELIPVSREGNSWTFTTAPKDGDPENTTYKLAPALDQLEVTQHPQLGPFNLISKQEAPTPQKGSVIADIYMESLMPRDGLAALDRQNRQAKELPEPAEGQVPVLPMRDHFRQMAAGPGGGHEEGLRELLPQLQNAGFSALLFKPFIGGDNVSSHRYWTIDPFVLNNTFQNKATFRTALTEMLSRGMKIYADGAFVNQGLNGVHMVSNLTHGYNSPYWRWLQYGDENQANGPQRYPSLAYQNYVFGILPTKQGKGTGQRSINYDRFAFRFINDPSTKAKYDAKRPTFIELYDPTLEDKQGRPLPGASPKLTESQDSVQNLRFPISVEELQQKRKLLQKQFPANTAHPPERVMAEKKLFCDWKNFRLDKPSSDDSSMKWDGQADTALMNTKNPEVVDYLDGAVGYWSRMVMNTQTSRVTEALAMAQQRLPSKKNDPATLLGLLNTITQKANPDGIEEVLPQELQVLPPITNPEVEELSEADVRKILADTKPACDLKGSGEAFTRRLLQEVPFDVLQLPTLFKANLCYPEFQKALLGPPQSTQSSFINRKILRPLSRLPVIGVVFKQVRDFFFPPSFETKLAKKMDKIFTQLGNHETRQKLRYANIQSLLADKLGERIYLSLLTNLDLDEVRTLESDPKKLEEAFYKGMPGNILKADPVTASKLLPNLLIQRLKKLNSIQLASQVEQELERLDPKLAALGEEVIKRREFGLNWRIDAAKDVADMDRVRNAEPAARPRLFQEEIQFVKKFWDQLTKSMRKPFPKAAVIAELTDFEMLTNQDRQASQDARGKLLKGSTFTSLPNLTYVYSPLLQLIGYAQRPDEYGDSQLTLSAFMRRIQTMGEDVPLSALHQYQNLTASHDYPTTSHALLINPALFNMDLLKWWGLKDDFGVAVDELTTKACFNGLRQNLRDETGIDNLEDALHALRARADNPDIFSTRVRQFFDENRKKASESTYRPTPRELKAQFIEELFKDLEPEEIGLDGQDQANALKQALKARMEEPSEAKAMRGAIVNAALQLPGDYSLERRQAEGALWHALDQTIQQWGRHFGYQPLDIALNHVFEKLDQDELPGALQDPAAREQWKSAIYRQATQPVMDKLLKVFAVQNALPGNPSVYLPDLFAQGGSEWTKNIFAQNRNLIRTDKFQDAQFQEFYRKVGQIFKTRSNPDLQVLNDGIVLPVTPDNENGVLPIVRDNGRQQAIVLVNTGTPRPLDWNHRAGTERHYETADRTVHRDDLLNYKPDLSELDLTEGTLYRDVQTGAQFRINDQGRLVSADNPHHGIDLRQDSRILVRVQ